MRDIKFRVWDKDRGFYSTEYSLYCGNGVVSNGVFVDGLKRRFVPEQFTGIIDAKGKEIYEGDVICGEFYDTEHFHSTKEIAPVVFNNGAFNISSSLWFKPTLKILGNIHQNPKLLEAKK
jgi:hypothetical protein